MSRIYEALQRAEMERRAAKQKEATEAVEPFAVPGAGEQPPVKADAMIEDIALRPWTPAMGSLPTLGDKGESIEQFHGLRSQIYQFRDAISGHPSAWRRSASRPSRILITLP